MNIMEMEHMVGCGERALKTGNMDAGLYHFDVEFLPELPNRPSFAVFLPRWREAFCIALLGRIDATSTQKLYFADRLVHHFGSVQVQPFILAYLDQINAASLPAVKRMIAECPLLDEDPQIRKKFRSIFELGGTDGTK